MGKVAAIQMTSGHVVHDNLQSAGRLLREAKEAGADIACLPENFPFIGLKDADKLAVAETEGGGAAQDFLAESAARERLWIIGGTLPLRVPGHPTRTTNSCLVYDATGRRVARYDKIHLFDVDLPGRAESYRESTHVERGTTPVVVDTPAGRVGLSVCYDVRFPELYRQLAAAGAEILTVPAAFTAPTGRAHWDTLLRARAIENMCYVVASAQTGLHANGRETYGDSLISDYWGRVLTRLPRGSGLVTADVDLKALRAAREGFPVLTHRVLSG